MDYQPQLSDEERFRLARAYGEAAEQVDAKRMREQDEVRVIDQRWFYYHGVQILSLMTGGFFIPRLWQAHRARVVIGLVWLFVAMIFRRVTTRMGAGDAIEATATVTPGQQSSPSTRFKDTRPPSATVTVRRTDTTSAHFDIFGRWFVPDYDHIIFSAFFALAPHIIRYVPAVNSIIFALWVIDFIGIMPAHIFTKGGHVRNLVATAIVAMVLVGFATNRLPIMNIGNFVNPMAQFF